MNSVQDNIEAANLHTLPAVREVLFVRRVDHDWVAAIQTFPKFNKQPFAQQVFVLASKLDPLITRFAVQINDYAWLAPSPSAWHTFDATTGTWEQSETPPSWVQAHIPPPSP